MRLARDVGTGREGICILLLVIGIRAPDKNVNRIWVPQKSNADGATVVPRRMARAAVAILLLAAAARLGSATGRQPDRPARAQELVLVR